MVLQSPIRMVECGHEEAGTILLSERKTEYQVISKDFTLSDLLEAKNATKKKKSSNDKDNDNHNDNDKQASIEEIMEIAKDHHSPPFDPHEKKGTREGKKGCEEQGEQQEALFKKRPSRIGQDGLE